METWILKEFFVQFGPMPKDEFLEKFDGGFLLVRFRDSPPLVVSLERDPKFRLLIGSEEDCDLDFIGDPTLDPEHCKLVYHEGFKGWTVEDLDTSFGTHLDGDRLSASRPTLLRDRSVFKPGGGLTELQFYEAKSLQARIAQSGVTRSLKRKDAPEDEAAEGDE